MKRKYRDEVTGLYVSVGCAVVFCFFFSSRRRHTRWTGDWSSDVCSSDLLVFDDRLAGALHVVLAHQLRVGARVDELERDVGLHALVALDVRLEPLADRKSVV